MAPGQASNGVLEAHVHIFDVDDHVLQHSQPRTRTFSGVLAQMRR